MRCEPCADRGRDVPATNLDYVRAFDATPRCDDCEAAAGEAQETARFAAYHGGGGAWPSASEQTDALQRMKGER